MMDRSMELIRRRLNPLMGDLEGLEYHFYGGCLRDLIQGKQPNDYDVGCRTLNDCQLLIDRLLHKGWVMEIETSYSLKFRYLNNVIDVATDVKCAPEERISKFDFTINALAYTSDHMCMAHVNAYRDIIDKAIVPLEGYDKPQEVLADRALKFWKEGYHSNGYSMPQPQAFELMTTYVENVDYGVFNIK